MKKELTVQEGERAVKTLNNAIKWIIEESSENICPICVYYDRNMTADEIEELDRLGICCRQQAEYGKRACYDGVKAHFANAKK